MKELPIASLQVKHVNERLADCRNVIDASLKEMDSRFPKSIFDQSDQNGGISMDLPEFRDDMNDDLSYADEETFGEPTVERRSPSPDHAEDNSSGRVQDHLHLDVASSYLPSETSYPIAPLSPGQSEVRSGMTSSHRRRSLIKNEMLKIFKLATGGDTVSDGRSGPIANSTNVNTGKNGPSVISDCIPIVTAIPRVPQHCYLQLFRLQIPSVLGTVVRIVGNGDGKIAGCTVHGEIFLFSRLPYSRHPDAITRGHDGGIVSLTWLSSPGLRSLFVTTGTDRKILLWEASSDNGIEGPHCELRFASVPTCCCVHRDVLIFGFLDNSFSTYKVEKTDPPAGAAGGQLSAIYKLTLARGSTTSFTKPITAISVSPDGRKLAVGSTTGTIGLFDLSTMSLDVEVDCRNRSGSTSNGRKVVGLNWSQDSTCVVISSCDSRVRIVLVSDLSRRTKFKSKQYTTENLFLGSMFGPPNDGRIIGVSESGHACIWSLHSSSHTNEKCLHANLINLSITGGKKRVSEFGNRAGNAEITAAHVINPFDDYCGSIQTRVFDLGEGFNPQAGHFIVCCDTSGSIGVFAELFTPLC